MEFRVRLSKAKEFYILCIFNVAYTFMLSLLSFMGYNGSLYTDRSYDVVYGLLTGLLVLITFGMYRSTMRVVDKYAKTEAKYYWLFLMVKIQMISSVFIVANFIIFKTT